MTGGKAGPVTMHPQDLERLRGALPAELEHLYLPGCEAPWLLAEAMRAPAPITALRSGRYAKLIDRPIMRGLLAAAGDGTLHPADLALLANPENLPSTPGPAANAALDAALRETWFRFRLSFGIWGACEDTFGNQTSRMGASFVVRLNFPHEHDGALMAAFKGDRIRRRFEARSHPVGTNGSMTLAWARLDWDRSRGDLLIEELQCDWIRFVRRRMANAKCDKERLRIGHYQRTVLKPFEKIWPSAMMLAAIRFGARVLECRRIWLHQPEPGLLLKGIDGDGPPRSLYTALPRRFCFEPTTDCPDFLARVVGKRLKRFTTRDLPIFWRLDLDAPAIPQRAENALRNNNFACGPSGASYHPKETRHG